MVFFFLLFLSLAGVAGQEPYIIAGCRIYSMTGELVRKFPGTICAYLPNGQLISASPYGLNILSPKSEILATVKRHFHHQINLSPDKKKIYALAQTVETIKGKGVKRDIFLVISTEGKVLHEVIAQDLLSPVLGEQLWKNYADRGIGEAPFEDSHFNSIYEIQENSSKQDYLKKGNLLVNSLHSGSCVITPDLSKVITCWKAETAKYQMVHDVQVTREGNLLYFVNLQKDSLSSAIDIYDPAKKKLVWQFTATPKEMWYSNYQGSVTEHKDLILFSDTDRGIYIVRRKDKTLERFLSYAILPDFSRDVALRVQVEDLTEFLSYWK